MVRPGARRFAVIFVLASAVLVSLLWSCAQSSTARTAAEPSAERVVRAGRTAAPDDSRARLSRDDGRTALRWTLQGADQLREPDGSVLVSVEVPRSHAETRARAAARDIERRQTLELEPFEDATERLGVTFPPGPDDATVWRSFRLGPDAVERTAGAPLAVEIDVDGDLGSFTRLLVGRPSTLRSRLVGAFDKPDNTDRRTIPPGTDYLGTQEAVQHIRIPAGVLGEGRAAFDAMVEFGDAPFAPERSNVDTVMVRTERIRVGETVPVRLVRFANRSREPIRVEGPKGEALYTITATLSQSARSGGFVTISPDGTYRSTTSLYPVLSIQEVDERGRAVGEPTVIDTGRREVPGFPFYLSSDGGRWTAEAPPGRLVDGPDGVAQGFFYDNGQVNSFFHSNGPEPGVLAACKKASAEVLAAR